MCFFLLPLLSFTHAHTYTYTEREREKREERESSLSPERQCSMMVKSNYLRVRLSESES